MDHLVDRIIRIPPPSPPYIVHSCLARSSFLSSVLGMKIFDKKKKRGSGSGDLYFPVDWSGPGVDARRKSSWKMFLFHRVGRREGRRCSTFLDARGCGIYASSTISANRFTPTDRGKSVSLHCLCIFSRGNIPRFHLNLPPTFNPLYLSLSFCLSVCFDESHLRSSRITGGRLSLDNKTCIFYRDFLSKMNF